MITAINPCDIKIAAKYIAVAAVFLLISASLIIPMVKSGVINRPPHIGDGVDYDSIALNLARGRGFGYFWDDPEWRKPYVVHNKRGIYDRYLVRKGKFQVTAFRPPAYPVILSVIYRIFGRKFFMWRVLNSFIIAAAILISIILAFRLGGLGAAIFTLLLSLTDERVHFFSERYLTEGMACFGVILLVFIFFSLLKNKKMCLFFLAGMTFGYLVVLRNIFVLWYPFVVVIVLGLFDGVWKTYFQRKNSLACLLFLVGALILPLPWWVRNCIALKSFMPFGTQAGVTLFQGYNDSVLWTKKNETSVKPDSYYYSLAMTTRYQEWMGTRYEVERMKASSQFISDWITRNIYHMPEVVIHKAYMLWKWRSTHQFILIISALLGCLTIWNKRMKMVFVTIIVAITTSVALTHSTDNGRYLFPIYPILYILGGIGINWVFSRILIGARNFNLEFLRRMSG